MTNHELKELVSKGIKGKYGDDRTVSLNQSAEIFTMIDNILMRNDWYLGDPVKASGFMNIITELCVQSGGEGDDQFTIYLDKFKELFKPEELPIVYIGFECPEYIKRAMLEEKELQSIEGNPFIIRFKTKITASTADGNNLSIEGNPFIIRFKT